MFVFFVIKDSSSIITATFLSIKLYLTLRRHMNQIQLTQVAQNEQGKSVQRKMRSAIASLYVYLIFTVCYLTNICVLMLSLSRTLFRPIYLLSLRCFLLLFCAPRDS